MQENPDTSALQEKAIKGRSAIVGDLTQSIFEDGQSEVKRGDTRREDASRH